MLYEVITLSILTEITVIFTVGTEINETVQEDLIAEIFATNEPRNPMKQFDVCILFQVEQVKDIIFIKRSPFNGFAQHC